jgi:hypothetical protein
MWAFHCEKLTAMNGLRFAVEFDSRPATVAQVVSGWQDDPVFRSMFNSLLADVGYSAFRWETPSVTKATESSQLFEFVVLDSPGLARRPDRQAFAEHFSRDASVVVFSNLGRDAILVVPCPIGDLAAYGHLAAFVRQAPESQRDVLWQSVGEAMGRRIGKKPVWLSTAGAGVSWLHVRLDDRPKYYGFADYT